MSLKQASMSLDKAINHGKEHRKPYYGSGKHDRTCRPNGGCPYCEGNREHKDKVKSHSARDESLAWEEDYYGTHSQPPTEETSNE